MGLKCYHQTSCGLSLTILLKVPLALFSQEQLFGLYVLELLHWKGSVIGFLFFFNDCLNFQFGGIQGDC